MKTRKWNLVKKYNNNHGIALISILIAVAFISIIGSALLYITYTNFQMKVMNNKSKKNYYETDGQLVRAVTNIRQYASNPTLADTIVKVDTEHPGQYIYELNNQHLGGMLNSGDLNSGKFNIGDGDEFQLSRTGKATKDVEGNVTTYTLENFWVKQTSKNDPAKDDHYYNKVQTNIELKIREQGTSNAGGTGVGECSMLFDSTLKCSANNQFTFLTLYGDSYFSSYYYGISGSEFLPFAGEGTYTQPGKYNAADPNGADSSPALILSGEAKINFMANYMVVFGDLVLKGDSALHINDGNLTVYGDIYILDNAILSCGGKIYQPSSPLPGRGTDVCCFKTDAGPATSEDIAKHVYYPSGTGKTPPNIAEPVTDENVKAFLKLLMLHNTKAEDDGIAQQIVKTVTYKTQNSGDITDFNIFEDQTESGVVRTFPAQYYSEECGVTFYRGDVINAEYPNNIVFMCEPKSAGGGGTTIKFDWWNSPEAQAHNAQLGVVEGSYGQPVWWWEEADNGSVTRIVDSNIHSTYISRNPLTVDVQAGCYISKMGSAIYDYLTLPTEGSPYYDENIHHFKLDFNGNLAAKDDNKFSAGDFLQTDANPKIQNLFSYGINGGSGVPTYINSVSFKFYKKDAD